MLNNYMGILCLNEKDSNIKSLTQNRPLASIPLGGRYRIIDFVINNLLFFRKVLNWGFSLGLYGGDSVLLCTKLTVSGGG